MPHAFDHEKLVVYHESLKVVAYVADILPRISKGLSVHSQLDRASTSIPLNIAEGSEKWTPPDRCRYYDSARASALECAACPDVLVVRKEFTKEDVQECKDSLIKVVSMLVGLVKSISPDRIFEEPSEYGGKSEHGGNGVYYDR